LNDALERERYETWFRERGTPLSLEHPQAWDAWLAAKADKEDEDAIKADVYDRLAELLEPYMIREGRAGGFLPASVSEAVRLLLERVLRSNRNRGQRL
jgi:hypothetical protein